MVRSIEGSLDYYTAQFGPYPYRHLTVVERPPNGTGMHADASMITHGEDFPSESRDKPRSLDLPFAVVAHEMGHQWGSLCVRRRGTGHGREPRLVLLDDVRRTGDRAASAAAEFHAAALCLSADPPGSTAGGSIHISPTARDPFAVRAERVRRRGADQWVAAAPAEQHLQPGAPLATTLDLYGELQAATPDSLQYLLHDLFEVNTVWDFEMEKATAEQSKSATGR